MTPEAIERLVHAAKPVSKPATAIGYSIQAQAGDRRTLVVQCHIAEDESDEVVNAALDRAMRMIDRQQAFYDLDAEMDGFHKVGQTLRLNIDGLPIAEQNMQKEIAVLKVKLQELEKAKDEEYQAGYADWNTSRRKGDYQPQGHRRNRLAILGVEIENAKAAIEAKPKDENQNRENVMKTIAHFQEDLKKRRGRINHLLGLLGRPHNLEYQDVEAFKTGT